MSAEVERKNAIRWKRSMLQGLEESKLGGAGSENNNSSAEDKSFMARLLQKIADNVRVRLR